MCSFHTGNTGDCMESISSVSKLDMWSPRTGMLVPAQSHFDVSPHPARLPS